MFWKQTLKKLYWENFTTNKNYELLKKKEENNENKITNLTKQMENLTNENKEIKEKINAIIKAIFINATKGE